MKRLATQFSFIFAITMVLVFLPIHVLDVQAKDGEAEHVHDWSDWETLVAPSCVKKGREQRQCLECGLYEKRIVKARHTIADGKAVMATCETPGCLSYEYCKYCDYSTYQEVPAMGHHHERAVRAVNHRGYSMTAPENTLEAYRLSKEKGFRYVECDVAFTANNVPVLLHDDTIDRTSNGTGKVSQLTYEELLRYDFGSWKSKAYEGIRIPSFESFVALCKELELHPYIELKKSGEYTKERVKMLVDIVRYYDMSDDVTWISFNTTYLNYVKNEDETARLGVVKSSDVTKDILKTVKTLQNSENEVFLLLNHHKLTKEGAQLATVNGVSLEVYTVNYGNAVLNLPYYVSGVSSDYLDANNILMNKKVVHIPPTSEAAAMRMTYCTTCGKVVEKEAVSAKVNEVK